MNRPFPHFDIARLPNPAGMLPAASQPAARRQTASRSSPATGFPRRPDISVLSEAIPLFYIGQNGKGLWVAREADGRSGRIFLFRRSAVRFAREKSEPLGCAMMFLREPLELKIGPETASEPLPHSSRPVLRAFFTMATAQWRRLVHDISTAFASKRRHRDALERELFHDQLHLVSKNDDDLPVFD